MAKVIILGAKGRFGRAAVQAFRAAGWETLSFGRNWPSESSSRIEGDVKDTDTLTQACQGCDVIVNAINPPYPAWGKELPLIHHSVIKAASLTGATVMLPGNVYNYGAEMPGILTEETPLRPTARKGQMRVEMENWYRAAQVPTIVLRGGDFIEKTKTGNWFDSHIAPKAHQGKTAYPAALDIPHAWAYLPDMARAMVGLAEKRHAFAQFEEFGFAGFGVTGAEMVAAIGQAVGKPQKVSGVPWFIIRFLGLFLPLMREVIEMAYLWRVPHVIDGRKLAAILPDFEPTPFEDAIAQALSADTALNANQTPAIA